ncbi:MAG: hypothetical protein LBM02_01670 [Lachnospiraceae bacterium]|jgi:gas vesicle protein|nr:hypothetical protein [Lachnospiraceae bacterium]
MGKDKSANERYELGLKIRDNERKQEKLGDFKREYGRSIERFNSKMQDLKRQEDKVLYQSGTSGNKGVINQLDVNKSVSDRINRFVNSQREELEHTCRSVRRDMEEERERLAKERNRLPWE